MYIIHWKYTYTGYEGYGKKAVSLDIAKAWIKSLPKDFIYWLVPIKKGQPPS